MKDLVLKYCILAFAISIASCNNQLSSIPTPVDKKANIQSKIVNPENGFNCGFLDSKGVLWFGSNGGGVYSYNGTAFTHFTKKEGLPSNRVTAIAEDKQGILWFGTAKGLSRYDGVQFETVEIPQSDTSSVWLDKVYPVVNPNQVMSLLQDTEGALWIGTNGAGVYRYNGKTFTQHLSNIGSFYDDSLQHNIVLSIEEDLSGNIWFSSLSHGGVSRYDGNTFTQFMPKDGLSDDMIRTIFIDRNGNIWFGTNGNRNSGLTYYDGKSFHTFTEEDGLCNTNIMGIYEDKKGNLWLSSDRGGICIFDGKTFTEFTSTEGQNYDRIYFIIADNMENIYFGGRNGLWKFDGESVTDLTK